MSEGELNKAAVRGRLTHLVRLASFESELFGEPEPKERHANAYEQPKQLLYQLQGFCNRALGLLGLLQSFKFCSTKMSDPGNLDLHDISLGASDNCGLNKPARLQLLESLKRGYRLRICRVHWQWSSRHSLKNFQRNIICHVG